MYNYFEYAGIRPVEYTFSTYNNEMLAAISSVKTIRPETFDNYIKALFSYFNPDFVDIFYCFLSHKSL